MKLVSIIIPTYNNFNSVFITLDSIFIQNYENIEIIISDDGSIEYFEYKEKLINYIENNKKENIKNYIIDHMPNNLGTVKNINNGIKLSKGEYIKLIGPADYFLENNSISIFVEFIESNNFLICFSKLVGITDKEKKIYKLESYNDDYIKMQKQSPNGILKYLYKRNCLPAPGGFFKKQIFDQYGYFIEEYRLIEDYPYWLHLANNNVKFGFLNEYLIGYKLNNSGAGVYNIQFLNDLTYIYKQRVFPQDKRFFIFQPIVNYLKLCGLNYYKEKSLFNQKNNIQKVLVIIKYFPFHLLVNYNKMRFIIKNKL